MENNCVSLRWMEFHLVLSPPLHFSTRQAIKSALTGSHYPAMATRPPHLYFQQVHFSGFLSDAVVAAQSKQTNKQKKQQTEFVGEKKLSRTLYWEPIPARDDVTATDVMTCPMCLRGWSHARGCSPWAVLAAGGGAPPASRSSIPTFPGTTLMFI